MKYPQYPHNPQVPLSRELAMSLVLCSSVEQLRNYLKRSKTKTCSAPETSRAVDHVDNVTLKPRAVALELARMVRREFNLSGRVVLPFMIQAMTLFKRRGIRPDEFEQAIREAACKLRGVIPKTMFFFEGWIRRLRAWKARMLREAEQRERDWEDEKRAYVAPRLLGVMANSEGPVAFKHLIDSFMPRMPART